MGLMDWIHERNARSLGKGCARAMLIGMLALKEHYADSAPTYAWLARKVLCTRPHWKQISEQDFIFDRNGDRITVIDTNSLADVIQMVVAAEVTWVTTSCEQTRRQQLSKLAHDAAKKYIHRA
jgi:hypothetical protein